ncbi:class I SAM-dependent methyltransferase [bacterium]|nr:class I SAM-dependent methyltransferase [bacterium]
MTNLSPEHIKKINQRYSNRLSLHGEDPKTLGWSSQKQQESRFSRMVKHAEWRNQNILDVGCGFGDLAAYIQKSRAYPKKYIGVDINPDLIRIAETKKYPFSTKFYSGDILNTGLYNKVKAEKANITIALGLFNLNFLNDQESMKNFLFTMLSKMIEISSSTVLIDFIPNQKIDTYPKEEYIATYDLNDIITFLTRQRLKYIIDMSQDPNPMSETLLCVHLP